jgi:O-antigen/teichoic acid export membrane protein
MAFMKILVTLGFLAILASLGAALFFMMRTGKDNEKRGQRMAWTLALRVGLSILLFVCMLLAWKLGYIQPTGVPLE